MSGKTWAWSPETGWSITEHHDSTGGNDPMPGLSGEMAGVSCDYAPNSWDEPCYLNSGHAGSHHSRSRPVSIVDLRPGIDCLCGDIFPTVEAMHEHIHMVHDEGEQRPDTPERSSTAVTEATFSTPGQLRSGKPRSTSGDEPDYAAGYQSRRPDHPVIYWLVGSRLAKRVLPGRLWARLAWWSA